MPVTKGKQKPEISIIGAGRLGTTLAIALAGKGYSIHSLVARRAQRARAAAALVNGHPEPLAAKHLRSLRPAQLFLITTPDDQIAEVAAGLSEIKTDRQVTALHASGALSAEVLAPLRRRGWATGSIHPLISVSDPRAGAAALRGAFWCLEGDPRALRMAKAIVRDLGGKSFSIDAADKPLYHAAAVMASGNVVALFDVALELLVQCGLTQTTAQSILLPLIASTIRNLENKNPERALTGTFARGDVETVKRHLAALQHNKPALALYRLLGQRSLKLAKQKHPRIAQLLKSV